MMLKEENKNKNNKPKDTPRELPPSRKEDPRLERLPRRPEETDSATSLRTCKTPSEEPTMLGLDKKKNSPLEKSVETMMTKMRIKNEVCTLQFDLLVTHKL